ncbi:MAG: DUF362 domain-containing protein [Acidobacteria bacterium]|uniref:DUF362 domain-containing protein n=1 Tax=Candidatus Polarisedimenticola svalbardensis TaxID=2886004 RepID=A0A8J7CCV7_9BACT|nr:DUF362 domain-containing protein [Candidatus Polarisedimenticola svalbardensis]
MIRAGLARTAPTYEGVTAPFLPGEPYPELQRFLNGRVGPPNPVFAAVRDALRGLGLDEARFGTADWNPLSDLVKPGGAIVLKPNFIRHWNPMEGRGGTVQSVITHGAVVRAMADYAFLAAGPDGTVTVAEAPQMDCDYSRMAAINALQEIEASFREDTGRVLRIIDMRREEVTFKDGVIVERVSLPGDPAGYRAVDLGEHSFFTGSGLDPDRFRGADYDSGPTAEHHKNGRNAYLLSETVLSADLVVNLPKLKTHKKTGVTLALKNMVGINGDKNWLPHHSLGSVNDGGDEFPETKFIDRLRSRATEFARPLLAKGKGLSFFRAARRMESAVRGDAFIRSGNWYGNRTTWRMCCDLNRCLYYSDRDGLHLDAPEPVRPVLTLIDGILAGEGEGPLAPVDVPLGAVIASSDPVAADLVAVRLMGFDETRLAKLLAPMEDESGPRITAVRSPADVVVGLVSGNGATPRQCNLDDIVCERRFRPHAGWVGHVERDPEN